MLFYLPRLIALACLIFSLGPLVIYGIFNTGSAALLLFGLILGGLAVFWDAFPQRRFPGYPPPPKRWWRNLRRGLSVLLGLAVAGGLFLSVPMAVRGWMNPPREEMDYTVVVLGCKVENGQPTRMLRRRLDAALEYLEAHPQAPVVVTGGVGDGEERPEAEVAREYLEARGLDPARIYCESASANTRQNLENAAALIREEGLPSRVALATDGFHQWRSGEYARMAGLEDPAALPASTPWGLFPVYWVREMGGIIKLYLLDR